LSIVEIMLLLIIALIVIPPDRLPEVMRAVGKILRELRLASNTIVRELSGASEDAPYTNERPQNNPIISPWSKGSGDAPQGKEPPATEPPAKA